MAFYLVNSLSVYNKQVYSHISSEKEDNFGSDPRESNVENYQKFSQEVKEMSHTKQTSNDTEPTKPDMPRSQFLSKVDEIPAFHNIWLGLLARYSLIKDKHPVVKGTMEYGENVAYWMEQQAEYVATSTKMDEQLKKLDSAALNGVVKIEDTHNNVRNRFHSANKVVRTRIEDTKDNVTKIIENNREKVNKGREWVRSSVFAPAHSILDFVENKFEAIMPKTTSESKISKEPGFVNTVSRLFDVTYRFNLGVLNFAGQKAKEVTDKKNWENFYVARIQPHTPSKVRVRQSIIYHEILKELRRDAGAGEVDGDLSYKENKELLEVDRKVINLGRAAVTKSKDIKQGIKEVPSKTWDAGVVTFEWSKKALGHLSEAKSIRDLAGIGLYEARSVLMEGQDRFGVLRNSTLLDGTISWMASQQKSLSNSM